MVSVLQLAVVAVLVIGTFAADPKQKSKNAPSAVKDEAKSKQPGVSMDTDTAKKFEDLGNQTRNITARWKRYPHRQERNQTASDYHNVSFCGRKVPRKFRHFFKNQTEEDILGPVDKRSYNLFRATRTGSALQKKSNLRAKQVPGSDQKLAEGGAAGKVAGKEPFATVLKDGYWPVGCYTDKMVTSADKFGDEKDKYNDLAGVSIALYDELLDKADHKPMTPTVCFEFCSTLPAMVFFGITEGRKCYCTPYFSPGPGNADKCDSVCEGDTTLMCGTTSGRSSVFEMHLCGP